MSKIHSASTKLEIKLMRILWRLGFRYRVIDKKLSSKPYIHLPRYHTVFFVQECF